MPASVEMSATTLDGAGQRVGDGGHAVEVGDDHAGTAGVEAAGEGGADAARGPGDDDVAVREVHDGDGRSRVLPRDLWQCASAAGAREVPLHGMTESPARPDDHTTP